MNTRDSIERFLSIKSASNLRVTTIRLYSRVLDDFANDLRRQKVRTVQDVMPDHVTEFLRLEFKRGVRDTTVATTRRIIIIWLRWMANNGMTKPLNWGAAVEKIRVDQRDPRFLTREECVKLLNACEHVVQYREEGSRKRDLALIAMMIDTGLREGELLKLRLHDIDLKDKSARVSSSSKGRKERNVWFSAKTARLLKAYLDIRPGAKPQEYLWVSRVAPGLSAAYVDKLVKRSTIAAGISHTTPHALRHTAATLMLNIGLPITDVQRILGHSAVSTTMRYVHLMDDDVRKRYQDNAPIDHLTGD